MRYLVDTCVLSELRRKRPATSVVSWMKRHLANNDFFVSSITIAEIERGIRRLGHGDPKRDLLISWLENEILGQFGDSIIPFDLAVAKKWGEIMAEADAIGRVRPPLDAQIVAMALVHNLVIVTRNVADMDFANVKIVNPFNSATSQIS